MLDGNFCLQQKRKNSDPEDFALNGGHAYFVEEEGFRKYLDHIGDLHTTVCLFSPTIEMHDDVTWYCWFRIPHVLS